MSRELHIRPATAEDMPTLGHVLGGNHAFFYRNRLNRQGVILTAWFNGLPAAAICISWEPADEPQVRLRLPGVPLFYRLHVREGARSQGIGTALLGASENLLLAYGHKRVAFGVDLHNRRAERLYRRLGYREWQYGMVATIREVYDSDGRPDFVPDLCRIFVKDLD